MEATQILNSWRQEQWTASKEHDLYRWSAEKLQILGFGWSIASVFFSAPWKVFLFWMICQCQCHFAGLFFRNFWVLCEASHLCFGKISAPSHEKMTGTRSTKEFCEVLGLTRCGVGQPLEIDAFLAVYFLQFLERTIFVISMLLFSAKCSE